MDHRAAVVSHTRERRSMAASRSTHDWETSATRFSRSEIEPFRCDVEPTRSAVHVKPIGELDLATVPLVDAELADLWAVGYSSVVLDLRNVCFLDSTGLHLLMSWTATCEAGGIAFRVIQGPPGVQRVIELAGVSDHLTFASPNGTSPKAPNRRP
jgi:anti-sigma B factor antagonist